MAEGSAPARNYRGLLRVHVLFGLRICTSVAPRISLEASAGRLLELGCSSGYRANRQFPGRDFHPLAFETQEVSPQSETQLTSDLPSCRTATRFTAAAAAATNIPYGLHSACGPSHGRTAAPSTDPALLLINPSQHHTCCIPRVLNLWPGSVPSDVLVLVTAEGLPSCLDLSLDRQPGRP